MKAKPVTVFGAYTLYDETQEGGRSPQLMHDAARPFVVINRHYRGYKGGLRDSLIGRFSTCSSATAAIRRHSAR